MKHFFRHGNLSGEVEVQTRGDRVFVSLNNTTRSFQIANLSSGLLLNQEGKIFEVFLNERKGSTLDLWVNGQPVSLDWIDERRFKPSNGTRKANVNGEVRAVMPGRVVCIHVKKGERVKKGMPLMVLEAMKMENEISAQEDGNVEELFAILGETVEAGALLLSLKKGCDPT